MSTLILRRLLFIAVLFSGFTPPLVLLGEYEERILPLLEQFCYDCHGDGASKGEVNLEVFEDAAVRLTKHSEWKRVWAVLQDQQMPPQNKKQPKRD